MSLSIVADGSNTFQVGNVTSTSCRSPGGARPLEGYNVEHRWIPRRRALRRHDPQEHANLFEQAYAHRQARARQRRLRPRRAREPPPLATRSRTPTSAAAQDGGAADPGAGPARAQAPDLLLRRRRLRHPRRAARAHADLLTELDDALPAFYGRPPRSAWPTGHHLHRLRLRPHVRSNGGGSDHGWGGHHMVSAAASAARALRQHPSSWSRPRRHRRGRWIPTTSVDEYSATLARWFGVSASDMPLVFPNIGRFAAPTRVSRIAWGASRG